METKKEYVEKIPFKDISPNNILEQYFILLRSSGALKTPYKLNPMDIKILSALLVNAFISAEDNNVKDVEITMAAKKAIVALQLTTREGVYQSMYRLKQNGFVEDHKNGFGKRCTVVNEKIFKKCYGLFKLNAKGIPLNFVVNFQKTKTFNK